MAAVSKKPISVAFRRHWPEYAMEALEIGLFMISACAFAILLFHPHSTVAQVIESPMLRRLFMGIAMGATAIGLIYSPMGQRSGAQMNPAVTLTFWRLGKIANADALFYIAAQFAGAIFAMVCMRALLGDYLGHSSVAYVATLPGTWGFGIAWLAEFIIAMLMMLIVLKFSNRKSMARYTGLIAGVLVASYIFIETPLSGMSMNPARTLGSSIAAHVWTGIWIYFTAPPLAMLLAAEIYLRSARQARVYCAKLNHFNNARCIFNCEFDQLMRSDQSPATSVAAAVHTDSPRSHESVAMISQETLYFG